jgi:hypothetical protein
MMQEKLGLILIRGPIGNGIDCVRLIRSCIYFGFVGFAELLMEGGVGARGF